MLSRVTGGEVAVYSVGWASSKAPGLEGLVTRRVFQGPWAGGPGSSAGEGESLAT